MHTFKSKKGFTLAELLVVVAIIAVLVAIAIPVFGASQKKAKLAVDHAAIRDAYAIVQIANNLEEVEINGVTKTFKQIEEETGSSYSLYCLNSDCSSLVPFSYVMPSDSVYKLTEDGAGASGICSTCEQWDNVPSGYMPPSIMHMKDWPIGVIYDSATHQLYLGFTT